MNSAAAADEAVRRARRRLIPLLLLIYIVAFLDRVNIGFAKQALQARAGISPRAYALGAGLFFLSYALLEVPSNFALHRVGARRWLSRIMISWGVVSAAMLCVRGPASFYGLRLLLGAAEAGFFPGILLYLTYWFPARSRGQTIGLFYFGAPLALIFGSPLSGALVQMRPAWGLAGWQWMFLLEGLLAVAAGVWVYVILRDGPRHVRWLTAEQQDALTAVLRLEAEGRRRLPSAVHGRSLVHSALFRYALTYCLIQLSVYGVVFFLPSEVSAILHTSIGLKVGLVSALPWICALSATYLVPRRSDRLRTYRRHGCITLTLAAAASLLFLSGNPVVAMLGLCLAAAGFIAVQPLFWALPLGRLSDLSAVAGIAVINAAGAAGSFLAPTAKVWADVHLRAHSGGLLLLAAGALLAAVFMLTLPPASATPVLEAMADAPPR